MPSQMFTVFTAVEHFDPSDGERWLKYTAWAKIPKLTEVVSVDINLCPNVIKEQKVPDQDWQFINRDMGPWFFTNLPYLLNRVTISTRRSILGIYHNPAYHISTPPADEKFTFMGYDMIEDQTQISALTNCGGFPKAFSNDELNEYGLISTFEHASLVRKRLQQNYPDADHANCSMYAIWRLAEG